MRYQIPAALFAQTFRFLRRCGGGQRECQVLWTSPWQAPFKISAVVHPQHRAHGGGFELSSAWISGFWQELARTGCGIRVQIHTHPAEAFHSSVDDRYPIIHSLGFLSLVIPSFGLGAVGFREAYLTEIGPDGRWQEVTPESRLVIIE